uniref:Diphthine--ammonia ligase n=1 Tax=Panagrolaimus sp. ES5 TaxID=591445 RepID=A0AC34FTU3_9BILA
MKVVGLISGGKDSIYNLYRCKEEGHEIICLANLKPKTGTETDSYMYQSVGHECIEAIAQVMQLPLYRRIIEGGSCQIGDKYIIDKNDEVEDLFILLKAVKEAFPDVKGVSVGAIASTYQKTRVENVCERLKLIPLCYLWDANQGELLQEMLNNKIDAITVKIACFGLQHQHIGAYLNDLQPLLIDLHEKYGVHICGEGGEYETLVLNCPLYREALKIKNVKTTVLTEDKTAPVVILSIELEEPTIPVIKNQVTYV